MVVGRQRCLWTTGFGGGLAEVFCRWGVVGGAVFRLSCSRCGWDACCLTGSRGPAPGAPCTSTIGGKDYRAQGSRPSGERLSSTGVSTIGGKGYRAGGKATEHRERGCRASGNGSRGSGGECSTVGAGLASQLRGTVIRVRTRRWMSLISRTPSLSMLRSKGLRSLRTMTSPGVWPARSWVIW